MFDRPKIHIRIALVWIFLIILLIVAHRLSIQPFKQNALNEINQLEQNIINQNWDIAIENEDHLEDMWKTHKFLVQLNNLTPSVSRFEQKLEDVKVLVNNQDKNALQYLGSLKNTLDSITKTFPTPEG